MSANGKTPAAHPGEAQLAAALDAARIDAVAAEAEALVAAGHAADFAEALELLAEREGPTEDADGLS